MHTEPGAEPGDRQQKRRSRWRRAAALVGAGLYALTGWLRLSEALRYHHYLQGIQLQPGPLYLAITGGMQGFLFTIVLLQILFRSATAPLVARISNLLYLTWMWADRIWIGTREAFYFYLTEAVRISILTLLFAFVLIQPGDYPKRKNQWVKNWNRK